MWGWRGGTDAGRRGTGEHMVSVRCSAKIAIVSPILLDEVLSLFSFFSYCKPDTEFLGDALTWVQVWIQNPLVLSMPREVITCIT